MHAFPHVYRTSAAADASSNVTVESPGLEAITTTPPPEFGGPEGHWSPETLLSAAVADCFILTFRAIARASKLDWTALRCDVDAILDRADGTMKFTRMDIRAHLTVPADVDHDKADKLLHKAESSCLVTNSLTAELKLETTIQTA